jgi:hypothetical protein
MSINDGRNLLLSDCPGSPYDEGCRTSHYSLVATQRRLHGVATHVVICNYEFSGDARNLFHCFGLIEPAWQGPLGSFLGSHVSASAQCECWDLPYLCKSRPVQVLPAASQTSPPLGDFPSTTASTKRILVLASCPVGLAEHCCTLNSKTRRSDG